MLYEELKIGALILRQYVNLLPNTFLRVGYKMNSEIKDNKRAAYHEAGHAIVAEQYGLTLKIISIELSEDGLTHGYVDGPADSLEHKRENLLMAAAFYMAGRVAEIEFYNSEKADPSGQVADALVSSLQDMKDLNEFCSLFAGEDGEEWQLKGSKEAMRILFQDDNIKKLEFLNEMLLDKKTVSYEDYKEAIAKRGL